MGQKARFQETLRRLAMIDEGFVEHEALLGLGQVATSALDPKTVALLRVGASVAIGSSAVCLEWSAGRALAAGASEDEVADVLLAVIPVAGLGRVVSATPDLAAALGYDVWAELERPDDRLRLRIKPVTDRVHDRSSAAYRGGHQPGRDEEPVRTVDAGARCGLVQYFFAYRQVIRRASGRAH